MMIRTLLFMLAVGVLTACHADFHHESLKDQLKAKSSEVPINAAQLSDNLLDGVEYLPSQFSSAVSFNVHQRFSLKDKEKCQDCHQAEGQLKKGAENRHKDVLLNHADPKTMDCGTCHSKSETWNLSTLQGETVDINHAYAVCGQCHFQQAKDWSGGAHGKRMGGWHGTTVRSNCADCHNPHKPGFESRWPSINPNHSKWKR